MPESFGIRFHVDHIIPVKHGGDDSVDNAAYTCPFCNVAKGSDISGLDGGEIVPFFNPRHDLWKEHFYIDDAFIIQPLTRKATVTARILKVNQGARVAERKALS